MPEAARREETGLEQLLPQGLQTEQDPTNTSYPPELWGSKSLFLNWGFWTVVLEKTLESPWDCKEIKPVHPKGNQCWIFIGRTDAEALILWPPDAKNWLTFPDPDAGKDWRQKEKGTTEDEMVEWHLQLYGHEFEQAPGVGDGQGSLACCSLWGRKELDMTEQLNWAEVSVILNHPVYGILWQQP